METLEMKPFVQAMALYYLLRKYWRDLLILVFPPDIETVGFRALVKLGNQWFTQYPQKGEGMDTWEPEYVVTSISKIGETVLFRTKFGKYHVNEVQAIAPLNANAYYFISEPQMVQFYRITVDATKRMMRLDQLAHEYETMMELLNKMMILLEGN